MGIALRSAAPPDAAEIAAVHVAAWLAAYRGLMPDALLDGISADHRRARWEEMLGTDAAPQVRVAVGDGVVVGFCSVARPTRDEDAGDRVAEIAALNVRPDAWGQGIGTLLMDDALDGLRRDGWQEVSLWVLDGNERAQRFYRRLGFVFDGASTTHAASGARELRMRLSLISEP